MAKVQGPVRPGTDEKVFRETGKSVPRSSGGGGGGSVQGPVREQTDEEIFRKTGESVAVGSARAKTIHAGFVKAEQVSKQRADAEIVKQRIQKEREQVTAFRKLSKKEQVQFVRDVSAESKLRELESKKPGAKLTSRFKKTKDTLIKKKEEFIEELPGKVQEEITSTRFQKFNEDIKIASEKSEGRRSFFKEKVGQEGFFGTVIETGSIPGATVGVFDIAGEKFGKGSTRILEKTGLVSVEPLSSRQEGIVGRVVSDVFLFGVATPLLATKGQIGANLLKEEKVILTGVNQKVGKDAIITDIVFSKLKPSKNPFSNKLVFGEKGIARGFTSILKRGNVESGTTLGVGGRLQTILKPQTGKTQIEIVDTFTGFERFVSRSFDKTSGQISQGVVKIGRQTIKFKGGTVGVELNKDINLITGRIGSEKGTGTFFGLTKNIKTKTLNINIKPPKTKLPKGGDFGGGVVGGETQQLQNQIISADISTISTQKALTSTVRIATAGVQKPITSSLGVGGRIGVLTQTQTKTQTTLSPTTQSISSLKSLTTQRTSSINLSLLGGKSKSDSKQRTNLRTAQPTKIIQLERQALRLRTGQKIILKTSQKQRVGRALTKPIFFPTKTKIPIRFPGFKITPSRRKRTPSTFGVEVRRRGKFKTIGSGLSLQQAISTGRQRVGSSLSATFKITPQQKGINLGGGFRTPAGFRRKSGGIFIEKRGLRLSTSGETREITVAKRSKSSKRRKKK